MTTRRLTVTFVLCTFAGATLAPRTAAHDGRPTARRIADYEASSPEIDDAPPADYERSRPQVNDAPTANFERSRPQIDDAPAADYEGSDPDVE